MRQGQEFSVELVRLRKLLERDFEIADEARDYIRLRHQRRRPESIILWPGGRLYVDPMVMQGDDFYIEADQPAEFAAFIQRVQPLTWWEKTERFRHTAQAYFLIYVVGGGIAFGGLMLARFAYQALVR